MTRTAISPRLAINSFFSMVLVSLFFASPRAGVGRLSGNRYEHIHVRLTSAILGRRHFLKASPHPLAPPYLVVGFCPGWLPLLHESHSSLRSFAAPNSFREFLSRAVEQAAHRLMTNPVQQRLGFRCSNRSAMAHTIQSAGQHLFQFIIRSGRLVNDAKTASLVRIDSQTKQGQSAGLGEADSFNHERCNLGGNHAEG